jgi:SPP1 gp7 family putative phage head morphogenesis protein
MPVPQNTEAAAAIASKPLLAAEIADQLSPQLRARAFAIPGVHHFNSLAQIRAEIADLLAGGSFGQDGPGTPPTWDTARQKIADVLAADSGDGTAADKHLARADRIIRLHTSQALAAQREAEHAALVDIFPYKQYLSMSDGLVRPAHRALEGLTLPYDDPFWKNHTPPWEWGCRCQTAMLTEDDVAEYRTRHPERVMDSQQPDKDLLNNFRLRRRIPSGDPSAPWVDLRAPGEMGRGESTWHFDWQDMTADITALVDTWDASSQAGFAEWAAGVTLPDLLEDGTPATLADWLDGKPLHPPPDASAVRKVKAS